MKNIKKYGGLRLKPNLDVLIENLESDQPIRSLPSRLATTLRNSHQLTQLDGDTLTDLNDMETRLQKEKYKHIILREQASQTGLSVAEVAAHNEATPPSSRESFKMSSLESFKPSSSESFKSGMSSMSSPQYYRMDTPFRTRDNTPGHLQHDEAVREEADEVDKMIQDNIDAQIARQLASIDLADQGLPASSDSIMKALTGAFNKIDFNYSDAPAAAARGSNDPPPPAKGIDESRIIEHWKKKSPAYIIKQLQLRGWRPPGNVDIKDVPKDKLLVAILIQLGINPVEGIQPAKRGRPASVKKEDRKRSKE